MEFDETQDALGGVGCRSKPSARSIIILEFLFRFAVSIMTGRPTIIQNHCFGTTEQTRQLIIANVFSRAQRFHESVSCS